MDYEYNNAETYTEEYEDSPLYKPQTRNIRRHNKNKALKRRRKIISEYGYTYKPMVGWYPSVYVYDSKTNKHICKGDRNYAKYPQNSRPQQYVKHRTSKRIRRIPLDELYGKGNIHRRCIDYWWELF